MDETNQSDEREARWYYAQMKDYFNCPKMTQLLSQPIHTTVLINVKIKIKIVLASEI